MEGKVLFGDIIKGLVLAHANFTEQRHSFSKTEIVFTIRKQENVLNYAVFYYPKLEQLTMCACVFQERKLLICLYYWGIKGTACSYQISMQTYCFMSWRFASRKDPKSLTMLKLDDARDKKHIMCLSSGRHQNISKNQWKKIKAQNAYFS